MRNFGSFLHRLDAMLGLRDLNEFLNDAAVGDASQLRPAPGNHARPAAAGTSTIFQVLQLWDLNGFLNARQLWQLATHSPTVTFAAGREVVHWVADRQSVVAAAAARALSFQQCPCLLVLQDQAVQMCHV